MKSETDSSLVEEEGKLETRGTLNGTSQTTEKTHH